jgi:arylsulfatase A-like enzyme
LVRNSVDVPLPGNAGPEKSSYSATVIADETLKFIDSNKDHPFFVYAAWTLPHGKYEIPNNAPFSSKPWSMKVRNYAAMVHLGDTYVGQVMDKLKNLGLDDKTLVFFTSDNGANPEFIGPLGSTGGLNGYKRMLYEGGTRTPFLARWPGKIKPGSTTDTLAGHVDFMATVKELIGSSAAVPPDGVSLVPVLLGNPQPKPHDHIYFEIFEPYFQQSVRWQDWKGYRLGSKEALELYDLSKDPVEKNNVAAQHPDIVKHLEDLMVAEHVDSPDYTMPEKAADKGKRQANQKQVEAAPEKDQ